MDANEFVKAVQSGNEKLRLDKLVLKTPDRELTGKGMLRIEGNSLRVSMTLDEGFTLLPRSSPGVYGASKFWKLSGIIENNLPFNCNFGPSPSQNYHNGIITLSATVNPINLEPTGWDTLTKTERAAKFAELAGKTDKDATEAADEPEEQSFEIHAWFPKYELVTTNAGSKVVRTNDYLGEYSSSDAADTLMGETNTYSFAFIQEDKKDLHLILRSKSGIVGANEAEGQKKFLSLLAALSFTHGINAWPYRQEYWRDGAKRYDRITSLRELPFTPHAPFSGMGHGIELAKLIGAIADRLEPQTRFNKRLTFLMFLFRQAGSKGVYTEITVLALCSLFESLVRILFDHFDLEETALAAMSLPEFTAAKEKLLAHLNAWVERDTSHQRLVGLVRSANPLTMREKMEAVCTRLGLTWKNGMEKVFKAWKAARNPLAHGKFGDDENEKEFVDKMHAESRIAGGFNTILLKFFGYSGPYKASAFEQGFSHMDDL